MSTSDKPVCDVTSKSIDFHLFQFLPIRRSFNLERRSPPPWFTWKSDHHDGILVKPQFPTGHLGVAFRKKRSIKAREMGNFHPAPFCPTPISAGRKSLCAPASCWWIRVVGYAAGYRINSACGCVRMRADAPPLTCCNQPVTV